MAVEYLVKRILWIAKCPVCSESVEKTENPPRERRCMKCDVWVPFSEESFTSPDLRSKTTP